MTENRNHKKRSRENVEAINVSLNASNDPPTKKRRIQSEQRLKLYQWSIDELKRYLNQNNITYQTNKDKSYYYRLVLMHKTVQENAAKEKREQKEKEQRENTRQTQSENKPRTPPLPYNLCHKPFSSNSFNDNINNNNNNNNNTDESESESESEEEKTPELAPQLSQPSQPTHIITPNTLKSRSILNENVTPLTQNNNRNRNPETLISNDAFGTNNNTNNNAINNASESLIGNNYNERRLGPFQDIPIPQMPFSFDGYSMPKIPTIKSFEIPGFKNKYVQSDHKFGVMICCTLLFIFIAFSIPCFVSLFVNNPYCDTDMATIRGTYYVFSIMPLQKIMKCNACPFKAECVDGKAVCDGENYSLDEYGVICLRNNQKNARMASQIANQAYYLLGTRLAEWQCKTNNSYVYRLDEETLKSEVRKLYFDNEEINDEVSNEVSNEAKEEANEVNGEVNDEDVEVSEGVDKEVNDEIIKEDVNDVANDKVNDVINKGVDEETNDEANEASDEVSNDVNEEANEVNEEVNDEVTKATKSTPIESNDFEEAWIYATTMIIPYAYDKEIAYDAKNKTYKPLRPIPTSIYCRGLCLKREYIGDKGMKLGVMWGFCVVISAVLILVAALRSKSCEMGEMGEQSLTAANFVLQKLSQQQILHYSIDQWKHFTMRTQGISIKTWEGAFRYINESQYIEAVPEDIDGQVRMCWKWKAPVPFVPLA